MTGEIFIKNRSEKVTEIDIEGIIGMPENQQFASEGAEIATYQKFKNTLREIEAIDTRKLIVNIRSAGGNVNDALLIYEALAGLRAEVTTRCYGYVASAATIIAQAGAPGHREVSANTLYLIHRSSSVSEGNTRELAQTIELLDKTDGQIAAVYAGRSGHPISRFVELMSENDGRGRWLTAKECVGAGLADRVIAPATVSNDAAEVVRKLRLPEIPEAVLHSGKNRSLKESIRNTLGFIIGHNSREEIAAEKVAATFGTTVPKESGAVTKIDAATELGQLIDACENPGAESSITAKEIEKLQNRIVELEALNAKLRTTPTATLPKEDPSTGEFRQRGNAGAYDNDIKNIKNL
ncbi:MAG: Clp protease ClpP [Rikenellaceae bacterium]|jgi:ATP-dependent protease ClpP protease subunit|nr:Clp protease ClpP [Rikenellaceae bacterium]